MARSQDHEKLWRYTSLVRLWSWALIGVGLAMFPLAVLTQQAENISLRYFGTMLGITGITGVLFFPLLRMWLRKSRPSEFLGRAKRIAGPRRLQAGPGDWRVWGAQVTGFLLVGTFVMLTFLVAVLRSAGPDGIAEGVVIGVLIAWGLVSLEDARRIRTIEADEGRTYFAVGRRPTAAGNHLTWTPADRQPPIGAEAT